MVKKWAVLRYALGTHLKVLVACEFSGIVRDAFLAKGHDAWSCDLLPSEKEGPHIQDDVLKHLDEEWDLMIAHPPCTYIAKSGVQWLHKMGTVFFQPDNERWLAMEEARDFFLKLLQCSIPKICVENPVPHRFAKLPKYHQIIQPYQFGHEIQKMTCLWLKGLPKLQHTKIVDKGERYFRKDGTSNGSKWYQLLTPNGERWKNRSRTFWGIAQAMADQWG